jgi:hypothetical protein
MEAFVTILSRAGYSLMLILFCASCRTPAPQVTANDPSRDSLAGFYALPIPDLSYRLDLRRDGTYWLSLDNWARIKDEGGVWTVAEGDVILHCKTGGLKPPIRHLRPDGKDGRRLGVTCL